MTLTFSEGVDALPDSIRVVAGDGTAVSVGSITQSGGKVTLAADVPTLADGTYVVAWRAISADSHPVAGAFTFSVGSPSTTNPDLINDLLTSSQPAKAEQAWLAIGKWASYVGIAMMIGAMWVLGAIWSTGLRTRRATVLLAVAGTVAVARHGPDDLRPGSRERRFVDRLERGDRHPVRQVVAGPPRPRRRRRSSP